MPPPPRSDYCYLNPYLCKFYLRAARSNLNYNQQRIKLIENVKEAFNIHQNVDVCCLLPLGYATEPFKQYGGRFPIEKVCFGESYGESF